MLSAAADLCTSSQITFSIYADVPVFTARLTARRPDGDSRESCPTTSCTAATRVSRIRSSACSTGPYALRDRTVLWNPGRWADWPHDALVVLGTDGGALAMNRHSMGRRRALPGAGSLCNQPCAKGRQLPSLPDHAGSSPAPRCKAKCGSGWPQQGTSLRQRLEHLALCRARWPAPVPRLCAAGR